MAPHFSPFAWKIPWTEEPGGLQSMGRKESDTPERRHLTFLSQPGVILQEPVSSILGWKPDRVWSISTHRPRHGDWHRDGHMTQKSQSKPSLRCTATWPYCFQNGSPVKNQVKKGEGRKKELEIQSFLTPELYLFCVSLTRPTFFCSVLFELIWFGV